MIAELEHIYRLLDQPEEADAAAIRAAFARRVAGLETQKKSAGSKPERLMAAKALAELTASQGEIEKLAAALEVRGHVDEARAALAERKTAKTKRALGNARSAAEKSGIASLLSLVVEVGDAFADSGLARDESGFDNGAQT